MSIVGHSITGKDDDVDVVVVVGEFGDAVTVVIGRLVVGGIIGVVVIGDITIEEVIGETIVVAGTMEGFKGEISNVVVVVSLFIVCDNSLLLLLLLLVVMNSVAT